jgi:predicted DNA-binding transcriptional regulator YafY
MPLLPPQVDPEVLDRVQEAVLGEMQMVANYQRIAVDEPREMLLHPLGMVQRGAVSYLVATAFNYQDIRLYALHRIKQVELREDGATIPPGFNLDKYVNDGALEFGDSQKMVLTLRVHHQVLNYLKETPLSTDMTIVDDGDWAEVTASVTDSWQLRWWLLSQGAGVVVLSPLALRQEIACEVMATAKLYGDLDV